MTFEHGAGPLLRPCRRGEAAHGKEGLWSVEFRSLDVGPWVRVCGWGLGPVPWRGSQRGSLSVEVGPWVGVWEGTWAGGRLRGQRIRPELNRLPGA